MPTPALHDVLRILAGESVFDRDTDSKILQASNEVTARALYELLREYDTNSPDWAKEMANDLMEISEGDPSVLIGFDDGRWQGREGDDEDLPPESGFHEEYLKLEFVNADACFYQFHLFPTFDEPFFEEVSRKRAYEFQYLNIRVTHPDDVQVFIQNLRGNPHLVKVHQSNEEEFSSAPSQNPG